MFFGELGDWDPVLSAECEVDVRDAFRVVFVSVVLFLCGGRVVGGAGFAACKGDGDDEKEGRTSRGVEAFCRCFLRERASDGWFGCEQEKGW